jgi:thiamine-monophosphate kinase
VRAAIDISDGLIADLQHVAAASEVTITIELGAIPTMDGVSALDAAGSGEEYELALTSRVELDTGEFTSRFGVELTRIGKVEEGAPGVILRDGDTTVDPPPGYLHFSK